MMTLTPTCGLLLDATRYRAAGMTLMVLVMLPSVGLVGCGTDSVAAGGSTFPGEDVHVRHPACARGVAV